jgi:putative CocE/NonD family hydrolase
LFADPVPRLVAPRSIAIHARTEGVDYIRRTMMIPMRDGVRLFTVIITPKGAVRAPILLTRTPYNAAQRAGRADSGNMADILPLSDDVFADGSYIRVFQDVRGKYGSEGNYAITRPVRGLFNTTGVDHITDAFDTIDWLVKHLPQSNGRVGMIGSSYEGFTVAMALLGPHPALKVAAPENPMIDGWMGDDWRHYGAFRQANIGYIRQRSQEEAGPQVAWRAGDDYDVFLRAGSADAFARANGLSPLPWWRTLRDHPDYDAFWQTQALDHLLATRKLTVPTMWVGSLWDQEDIWGAVHAYAATQAAGAVDNHLVLGPWPHSGMNFPASTLGPLRFGEDTGETFRREILRPFFDRYLKDGAPPADTPHVFAYQTGANRWQALNGWRAPCLDDCPGAFRRLYLQHGHAVSFTPPLAAADDAAFDEYVSDPANPIPYAPRPIRFGNHDAWRRWLVEDQRFASRRRDVLTYTSTPLTAPLAIAGQPIVNLVASTSGTDSDWVVKLIDVYPEKASGRPNLAGYALGVSMDIFRGRYRSSFSRPTAIPAGRPETYRFTLPTANHVFLPGHRVQVQIQSSWFPLYDRNPQTFVANILTARPGDYRKATQRVFRAGGAASFISLPTTQE